MPLARCPELSCRRYLDVPEIPASWRGPDGRCATCNHLTKDEMLRMCNELTIDSGTAYPYQQPQVETGVAFPGRVKTSVYSKYPFARMQAPRANGQLDSFFIPVPSGDTKDASALITRIQSATYTYRKSHDKKLYVRALAVKGGVRVWRVR